MHLARLLVTATAAVVATAPLHVRPLAAQAAAQSATLPTAAQITARHVAAIGGREALLRIASLELRGTMEMPAMGLKADMVSLQAKPNRTTSRVSIAGIGEIASGYDGETAWEMNPMQGPRLISGKELDAVRDDADFGTLVYAPSAYKSLETVGAEEFEGQKAYKVRVVRASGRELHEFFSVESGLLIGRVDQRETPMGAVAFTAVFADYKDFGGIKYPTRTVQKVDQQQMVLTVTNVTAGAVPDAAFALPDAVKALKK